VVGLLDHDDLAAELGVTDGESLGGLRSAPESDLSDLENLGNGGSSLGLADDLALPGGDDSDQ
jgi:DNA-directed RNA polymerase subunit beta'